MNANVRIRILVGAAALAAVLLAGCSQRQLDQAGTSVSNAGNALASSAPKLLGEGVLAANVMARLARIDGNSALHVAASANGGTVRLTGKVLSDATRERFIAAARGVSGVSAVDSQLGVDPNLPKPAAAVRNFALETAVHANLAEQAGINGLTLHVVARGAVVTLSGTAKTEALKTTLLSTARKTAGVREVVDRLHVAS